MISDSTRQPSSGNNKFSKLVMLITLLCILLFALLIFLYGNKQQFNVESSGNTTLQEFIEQKQAVYKDGKITLTLNPAQYSALLNASLKNTNISKNYEITKVVANSDQSIAFIIKNNKGKQYSYTANTEFILSEKDTKLKLSSLKMGKYNSRLFGFIYKMMLGLESEFSLEWTNANGDIYVKNIEQKGGLTNLTLAHHPAKTTKFLSTLQKDVDNAKLSLQETKNTINKNILSIYKQEITADSTTKYIAMLQDDEQTLQNTALLLKESAIYQLLNNYAPIYDHSLNVEKIVEQSSNEIEKSIQQYHLAFSKNLLAYLYNNKNYEYTDGQIILNGNAVTAQTIIEKFNLDNPYNISLAVKDEYIVADYQLEDLTISKNVLRRK